MPEAHTALLSLLTTAAWLVSVTSDCVLVCAHFGSGGGAAAALVLSRISF
jgi:hypothetical protein